MYQERWRNQRPCSVFDKWWNWWGGEKKRRLCCSARCLWCTTHRFGSHKSNPRLPQQNSVLWIQQRSGGAIKKSQEVEVCNQCCDFTQRRVMKSIMLHQMRWRKKFTKIWPLTLGILRIWWQARHLLSFPVTALELPLFDWWKRVRWWLWTLFCLDCVLRWKWSQKRRINVEKLRELTLEVYLGLVNGFPWAVISPSVHCILAHNWEVIGLNGGDQSEEGLEALNKLIRQMRAKSARKDSNVHNFRDTFNNWIIALWQSCNMGEKAIIK